MDEENQVGASFGTDVAMHGLHCGEESARRGRLARVTLKRILFSVGQALSR